MLCNRIIKVPPIYFCFNINSFNIIQRITNFAELGMILKSFSPFLPVPVTPK